MAPPDPFESPVLPSLRYRSDSAGSESTAFEDSDVSRFSFLPTPRTDRPASTRHTRTYSTDDGILELSISTPRPSRPSSPATSGLPPTSTRALVTEKHDVSKFDALPKLNTTDSRRRSIVSFTSPLSSHPPDRSYAPLRNEYSPVVGSRPARPPLQKVRKSTLSITTTLDEFPSSQENLIDVPEVPPLQLRAKSPTTPKPVAHANVRSFSYDEPEHSALEHAGRLWSPWPLRIVTILALLIFFMGCIAILEGLSLASRRDNKLRSSSEQSRFLWTYLPPLGFFVVASFWGQIEYRTKQQMPWRTMANAPAAASHSVLINYISLFNITALLRSLGAGHPGVAVSIVVGFLLKLLIIFSTAILVLQNGLLSIQTIVLRAMEAFLALSVILTAAMLLLRPNPATPCDTSTLSGLATVLSNSRRYNKSLKGLALSSPETFSQELGHHRYQAVVGYKENEPFFRISLTSRDDENSTLLEPPATFEQPGRWWSPINDGMRLLILGSTFGTLVAVELLHQRSKKHGGLANISDTDRVRIAWQVVPAAIAVILFSFIGLLDYAIRIAQPYVDLRRGSAPAQKSISVNYLADIAPVAIVKSLMRRHFGVTFSALAILLAPLLTLVAAGLYFPDFRDVQTVVAPSASSASGSAANTTRFSTVIDPRVSTASTGLSAAANAVLGANGTGWPAWTQDDLVFPALSLADGTGDGSQTVQTSATYSTMNCSTVPNSALKIWIMAVNRNIKTNVTHMPNVAIPVDAGCGAPCRQVPGQVDTCHDSKQYIYTAFDNPANGSLFGSLIATRPSPPPAMWRDSCPQMSIVYGQSSKNGTDIDNVTVMNCYPAIMQAEGSATFSLPEGSVTGSQMDRSRAQVIVTGDRATIDLFPLLRIRPLNGSARFDPAFAALTSGRDALPSSQILGQQNIDTVRRAFEKMYGRVMAQKLNLENRVSAPKAGTLAARDTRLRIVQDTVSTRVLEGLLAAIFVLLVLASLFTETSRVLPYNPCSIARMSTLIADSEFVRGYVPVGSEWKSEKERRADGIWKGQTFSTGFFDRRRDGEGVRKVFGIDLGEAEKVEA